MLAERKKILIGGLGILFIIVHTAAICIVSLPQSMIPAGLKNIAGYYTSEIFDQQWDLFAPCPIMNSALEVRYVFGHDTTTWIRPAGEAMGLHRILRFTHHGEIAVAESNMLYWVQQDILMADLPYNRSLTDDEFDRFKMGYSPGKISAFIQGTGWYLYGKFPDSALVRCRFTNVATGQSGIFYPRNFHW